MAQGIVFFNSAFALRNYSIAWKVKNTKALKLRLHYLTKRRWTDGVRRCFAPFVILGSPIGLGIFFIGLGYLIKCTAVAARKEKESKDTKG